MDFPGKSRLPVLGVGLSFRSEIGAAISRHCDALDFVELILDTALNGALHADFERVIVPRLTVVGHGVNASIGTRAPLDDEYVRGIEEIAAKLRCPWFSEHLAYTRTAQIDSGILLPIQLSIENAQFIAAKIRRLSDRLARPFLIENTAYYYSVPGSTLTECDFLLRVLESARCGLLLDLNNLHANALNHGVDPCAFIDRLPSELIVEIHVAGGRKRGDLYIDTHGHAVNEDVLGLLDYTLSTKKPNAVVLEREQNLPPIEELMAEVGTLKSIWTRHRAAAGEGALTEALVQ